MTISIDGFKRWFQVVEELGGKVPERLLGHLESVGAFRQAIKDAARGRATEEVLKAIQSRQEDAAVSVDSAHDLLMELGEAGLVTQHWRDLMELDYPVAQMIRDDLRGDAGDALVDSLRGPVGGAIRGIERAGEFFNEGYPWTRSSPGVLRQQRRTTRPGSMGSTWTGSWRRSFGP